VKDATQELIRAFRAQTVNFMNFTLEEARSRSWASATFTGTRHRIAFRLEGANASAAADALLNGIEEREFALRGHILADIALVARTGGEDADRPFVRIALEALTVEDA
jgi:hypothetical protein